MQSCFTLCCFNFDTLAQGNAHKPTKELKNYREPSGDRTRYLQTEATQWLLLLNTDMVVVVELLPRERQETAYSV